MNPESKENAQEKPESGGRREMIEGNVRELSLSLIGWHNSKASTYSGIEGMRKIEAASSRRLLELLIDNAHDDDYQLVLNVGNEPLPTHYIDRGGYDRRSISSGDMKEPGEEIVIERMVESARKYEEKSSLFVGKYDLVQFDDLAKAMAEQEAVLEVRFGEQE